MLTSSGGSLNADRGEGGKICQNLADVICERSLCGMDIGMLLVLVRNTYLIGPTKPMKL